jgi:uncharacterized protein (TIGR00725 family)
MIKHKLKIAIVGSASDLDYGSDVVKVAEELGKEIAKSGNILACGAESHCNTLPTLAAISAQKHGGIILGFSTGKNKVFYNKDFCPDILICTGLELGGGREFVFINSVDAVISVSGGVGTLTEMAIAYQSNIPIFAITNSGGSSRQMSGKYFDKREIQMVRPCADPEDAVNQIMGYFNQK